MEETLERPKLTEEEVSIIMEKKLQTSNFEVINFTLEMIGEWIGLCGDHAILKIILKPDASRKNQEYNFFVKLYPRVPFIIDFIEKTGSFKKEIFIYKLFDLMLTKEIKLLQDSIPRCYLTVEKKHLILDNLLDEGYSTTNKNKVFDFDTIKLVLQSLSKLHASSLIYEEKNSCRLIDIYGDDFEETYFNHTNKQGIDAAITGVLNSIELFNFPEKLLSGKNFRTVLEEVCLRVFKLAKPSKTFRNVVCHGDIWATNVLIKYDVSGKPVKCKLVDFQCGRYAPPAQDVMAVIYLTTSREFRKKYMYNLIGIYYTQLEKYITLAGFDMKKIIPFDEFLASCEEQKAFGLVETAVYFPLILLDSRVVQEYFGGEGRNRDALNVDRSLLVKEQIDSDESYRNRIRDSIQDLKDYCDYIL